MGMGGMGIAHMGNPMGMGISQNMGMGMGGNWNWIDGNGREWECWKPFPHISTLKSTRSGRRNEGLREHLRCGRSGEAGTPDEPQRRAQTEGVAAGKLADRPGWSLRWCHDSASALQLYNPISCGHERRIDHLAVAFCTFATSTK